MSYSSVMVKHPIARLQVCMFDCTGLYSANVLCPANVHCSIALPTSTSSNMGGLDHFDECWWTFLDVTVLKPVLKLLK